MIRFLFPFTVSNLASSVPFSTRGSAGHSRPFRPGGLDGSGETVDQFHQDFHRYRTAEAMAHANRPLEQGVEASWRDGSLILAPPGVDFEVGLSWLHVHPDTPIMDTDSFQERDKYGTNLQDLDENDGIGNSIPMPKPSLFTKSFFDDDSLFGSSSSGSSSDDEDESGRGGRGVTAELEVAIGGETVVEKDPGLDGSDEVDNLLAELSVAEDPFKRRKKANPSFDPLLLAEQRSRDQTNSTRKTWASTKLLPIHDFNAMIPNPAMSFPFTLDDFQQQAVARLERSESVFVGAHTSAGKTVGE